MGSRYSHGQILIELLSFVAVFIIFMTTSILIFEDFDKTSYQYLLTLSQEK